MLKRIGLFHTPKDWDELMAWIHQHNVEDRAHLTTAAGMALNLAVSQASRDGHEHESETMQQWSINNV